MLQQLVTVERSPLLLPRRHRLPPQEIRVDRAAFLQDLEHLFLHRAVGVVQMQEQLLEEELQMSGAPLGVVFLSQAGQPEAEGLEGDAADLLAAVVQPLQQVWVDLVEDVRVQAGSCELQDDGQRAASKHSARLSVFFQSGEHQRDELLQTQQLSGCEGSSVQQGQQAAEGGGADGSGGAPGVAVCW